MKKSLYRYWWLSLSLFTPLGVGAQDVEPPDTIGEVINLLTRIVGWMAVVFWIAAVISGLFAAYLYLTGGSKPDNISKANRQMVYTVVAIIVAIFSFVLPSLLDNIIVGV
jgi:hypothetical protein